MHNPPALTAAVAAIHNLAIPFRSLIYRASHLRDYSSFPAAQPLFCGPAGVLGSRYVAPSGPAALYLAGDADTAFQEFNQFFYRTARGMHGRALVRHGNLRPDPCVTLGVYVRLSRLLDLTRSQRGKQTRRQLGISNRSDRELLQPWAGIANAPTSVLGTEVFNDGFFEGIVYPSAQNRGHICFVLFPARLLATSQVHFHDAVTNITGSLP